MDLFDAGNHGNLEPTGKERDSPCHERQVAVDPISLQQGLAAFFGSKPLPPIKTSGWHGLLPPLSPAKSKFLSHSLPNSASPSPRFPSVSNLLKRNKKWMRHGSRAHTPPRMDFDHLMTLSPYLAMQQEMRSFRRSKSCGEGRAIPPSIDFDLLATQANKATGTATSPSDSSCTSDSSESECRQDGSLKKNNFPGTASDDEVGDSKGEKESRQEEFKCGALCLFLPGFGKAKPVKSKKGSSQAAENSFVISRTVSLEKFECGSWASPAIDANGIIGHYNGGGAGIGDSTNHLYFDLPLEMIRSGANDTHSPVTAAFIFDKERKGVLKKSGSARKSHGSSRHVRFSTSSLGSQPASPTSCITPRLRKAREDFNAFLEAQSA